MIFINNDLSIYYFKEVDDYLMESLVPGLN